MYQITNTYTRPNTDVNFFDPDHDSLIAHVWENYSESRLYGNKEVSTDGLTLVQTSLWVSREAFESYSADPIVQNFLNNKKNYLIANGISIQVSYEEI